MCIYSIYVVYHMIYANYKCYVCMCVYGGSVEGFYIED